MGSTLNPLISAYKRTQGDTTALNANVPFVDSPSSSPPTLGANIAMPSSLPSAVMNAPTLSVQRIPRASELAQQGYDSTVAKPIGVDTISNPLLRGIAKAGDIAASVFAPRVAQFLPGTTLNHERQVGIAANRARQAEAQDKAVADLAGTEAQTAQEKALTDFTKQRPAILQSQIDQKQTAVRDRVAQQAAAHGQKVTWDEEGNPSYEDDPNLIAHAAQQAQIDLHTAQAAYDAAKNDPNSPTFKQKEKQLEIARANAMAAQIRAGAYQGNYLMHAYGVGLDKQPLTGIGTIDGAPVGTSMQSNVTKSLSGNAQFDDVQQGIDHTNNALTALEASGGKLSSPAMIAALGHSQKGLGQWLQSKAASTLTPQERDAVVSVNAMRERILAMRKASGGNASEAQVDRMISMLPGPQTPDLDTAQRQLREVQSQLNTLRPGIPQVNRPGGSFGKVKKFNPQTGRLE